MYNKQPNKQQPKSPPNKQPNNQIQSEIEADPIRKIVWTPPDIKFKTLKHQYKKGEPNVKCVYCGKEDYKRGVKIKVIVCDECNEKNIHPKQEISPLSTSQLLGNPTNNISSDLITAKTIPEELPETVPTTTSTAQVSCKCGSTSFIKYGKRNKKGKDGTIVPIQKFQCKKCALFFNSSIKINNKETEI